MDGEQGEVLAIDTVDYAGVPVRCSREWWEEIVGKHPEVRDGSGAAAEAIADPDLAVADRDISIHAACYRRLPGSRLWIKVVVRYEEQPGGRSGQVVTAFYARRIRSGDRVLYQRDV